MKNNWNILDCLGILKPKRKQFYIVAECTKCNFTLYERKDHFLKRTNCPNCEMNTTRAVNVIKHFSHLREL